jgi:DsbC/DsbD-like thiol-disulfide interchange protein
VCIPEYADLKLNLTVSENAQFNQDHLPMFSETREKLPADLDYWEASATVEGETATLKLTTDAF